jgi:hypothetical protein
VGEHTENRRAPTGGSPTPQAEMLGIPPPSSNEMFFRIETRWKSGKLFFKFDYTQFFECVTCNFACLCCSFNADKNTFPHIATTQ